MMSDCYGSGVGICLCGSGIVWAEGGHMSLFSGIGVGWVWTCGA